MLKFCGRMRSYTLQPSDTYNSSIMSPSTRERRKTRRSCMDISLLAVLSLVCVLLLLALIIVLVMYVSHVKSARSALSSGSSVVNGPRQRDEQVLAASAALDSIGFVPQPAQQQQQAQQAQRQQQQQQQQTTDRMSAAISRQNDAANNNNNNNNEITQPEKVIDDGTIPAGASAADYRSGVVVSDNNLCSEAGRTILVYGGNAVDAAIAVQFCLGAVHPHNTGLGGGLFMNIYQRKTGQCTTIDGREAAPNTYLNRNERDLDKLAWQSVGVPGQLHALRTAYEQYGSGAVHWSALLLPTIRMLMRGTPIDASLASAIADNMKHINDTDSTLNVFQHRLHDSGRVLEAGDVAVRAQLAELLRELSDERINPIRQFYDGPQTKWMVNEIKAAGWPACPCGVLSLEDMRVYSSRIADGLLVELPTGLRACSAAPPSQGAAALALVNVVGRYLRQPTVNLSSAEDFMTVLDKLVTASELIDQPVQLLGDTQYSTQSKAIADNLVRTYYAEDVIRRVQQPQPQQQQSIMQSLGVGHSAPAFSQLAVVDKHDNLVVVSSSLGSTFGAKRRSVQTGLIWNNAVDAFVDSPTLGRAQQQQQQADVDGQSRNQYQPSKRPMSHAAPLLVWDTADGRPRLAVTGSDAYVVGYVASRVLWLNETGSDAVRLPRIRLSHSTVLYERAVPQSFIEWLQNRGHVTKPDQAGSICHLIEFNKASTKKTGVTDGRLGGAVFPAGYRS